MLDVLLQTLRTCSSRTRRQRAIDAACKGKDQVLRGVSLAGCNLTGLHLVRMEMHDADLRGAVCSATTLPPLVGCNLDGLRAPECFFTRLERCTLRGAALAGGSLGGRIVDCDFMGADLRVTRLPWYSTVSGSRFAEADLRGLDAAGARLTSSDFSGAALASARLSRVTLDGSRFHGADLSGANLARASLDGADLSGARLERCIITPEAGEVLRRWNPAPGSGLVTVSPGAGRATEALAAAMRSLEEYNLRWRLASRCGLRDDMVLLWKCPIPPAGAGAGAFRHPSREPLRIYPSDNGITPLSVFNDLAADYADSTADPGSVSVTLSPWENGPDLVGAERDLRRQLIDALPELFTCR